MPDTYIDEKLVAQEREAIQTPDPKQFRDYIKDTPITSVSHFLIRTRLLSAPPVKNVAHRYYFRGEPERDSKSELTPGLLRERHVGLREQLATVVGENTLYPSMQKVLVQRLVRLAEQYRPDVSTNISPDDFLSWVCIAQHHALPTLLLDWSLNPLVGLYFACRETSDRYTVKKITDSISEAIETYLAGMNSEHLNLPVGVVMGGITSNSKWPKPSVGAVWRMRLKPTSQRQILTIHLDEAKFTKFDSKRETDSGRGLAYEWLSSGRSFSKPVLIVPRILTRRIESQAGRFTYSEAPLTEINDRTDKPWNELEPIAYVNEADKDKILNELYQLRLHEGSLFADLDHYARFLSQGGF